MKLSAAIAGYWLDKKLDFSPRTVVNYSRVYSYFIAFVGDIEISKVTSNDIRRFLVHLTEDRKYSRRSVHDAWIPLSSLWTWAEKELQVAHIIRGKVKCPDFSKAVIEPFTQDEVKRLMAAILYTHAWKTRNGKIARSKRPTTNRDKALIVTLLDTGVRASELCALTIADYDEGRGRLYIKHGKGDKRRFVFMGMRARKAIWKYLADRSNTKPTSPLFAAKTEQPLHRDNLRHTLEIIAAHANVAHVYPHRFRHTFAITFLRNGGNVLVLKELLGHESLETVMEYVKLAELDMEKAQSHSPADNWRI